MKKLLSEFDSILEGLLYLAVLDFNGLMLRLALFLALWVLFIVIIFNLNGVSL